MQFIYKTNCSNINWDLIPQILEEVNMGYSTPLIHKISFEKSFSVIFVFHQDKLIGFGRLISDGCRQSAIYDVAIRPEYQKNKIGSKIVTYLMSTTPDCNFILYASPGKEIFYEKKGFKKMKTGMILFSNNERMNDPLFVEI